MKQLNKAGQRGANLVEYALLILLIAIVAIIAMRGLGFRMSASFSEASSHLAAAN